MTTELPVFEPPIKFNHAN